MKKSISLFIAILALFTAFGQSAVAKNEIRIIYAEEFISPVSIQANIETSFTLLECEPGEKANKCCPYWDVEFSSGFTTKFILGVIPFPAWETDVTCTTGGEFKCDDNCEEGN